MKIIEHIPSFFEGFTTEKQEFNTKEELLEIDFVKHWETRNFGGDKFEGFAITFDGFETCYYLLIAMFNENRKWFVVGYIQGTRKEIANLNLPNFEEIKNDKKLDEKFSSRITN